MNHLTTTMNITTDRNPMTALDCIAREYKYPEYLDDALWSIKNAINGETPDTNPLRKTMTKLFSETFKQPIVRCQISDNRISPPKLLNHFKDCNASNFHGFATYLCQRMPYLSGLYNDWINDKLHEHGRASKIDRHDMVNISLKEMFGTYNDELSNHLKLMELNSQIRNGDKHDENVKRMMKERVDILENIPRVESTVRDSFDLVASASYLMGAHEMSEKMATVSMIIPKVTNLFAECAMGFTMGCVSGFAGIACSIVSLFNNNGNDEVFEALFEGLNMISEKIDHLYQCITLMHEETVEMIESMDMRCMKEFGKLHISLEDQKRSILEIHRIMNDNNEVLKRGISYIAQLSQSNLTMTLANLNSMRTERISELYEQVADAVKRDQSQSRLESLHSKLDRRLRVSLRSPHLNGVADLNDTFRYSDNLWKCENVCDHPCYSKINYFSRRLIQSVLCNPNIWSMGARALIALQYHRLGHDLITSKNNDAETVDHLVEYGKGLMHYQSNLREHAPSIRNPVHRAIQKFTDALNEEIHRYEKNLRDTIDHWSKQRIEKMVNNLRSFPVPNLSLPKIPTATRISAGPYWCPGKRLGRVKMEKVYPRVYDFSHFGEPQCQMLKNDLETMHRQVILKDTNSFHEKINDYVNSLRVHMSEIKKYNLDIFKGLVPLFSDIKILSTCDGMPYPHLFTLSDKIYSTAHLLGVCEYDVDYHLNDDRTLLEINHTINGNAKCATGKQTTCLPPKRVSYTAKCYGMKGEDGYIGSLRAFDHWGDRPTLIETIHHDARTSLWYILNGGYYEHEKDYKYIGLKFDSDDGPGPIPIGPFPYPTSRKPPTINPKWTENANVKKIAEEKIDAWFKSKRTEFLTKVEGDSRLASTKLGSLWMDLLKEVEFLDAFYCMTVKDYLGSDSRTRLSNLSKLETYVNHSGVQKVVVPEIGVTDEYDPLEIGETLKLLEELRDELTD